MIEALDRLPVHQLNQCDAENHHGKSTQDQTKQCIALATARVQLMCLAQSHDQIHCGQNAGDKEAQRSMASINSATKCRKR